MPTIVIVNRDPDFTEQVAEDLSASGYRVITCVEGNASVVDCADLMICAPQLVPERATRCGAPPVLLAWAPSVTPDPGSLLSISEELPGVDIAARSRTDLICQINAVLARALSMTRRRGHHPANTRVGN
jgi:hypothetical protein